MWCIGRLVRIRDAAGELVTAIIHVQRASTDLLRGRERTSTHTQKNRMKRKEKRECHHTTSRLYLPSERVSFYVPDDGRKS